MKYTIIPIVLALLVSTHVLYAQTQWQVSDSRQVPGQLELRAFGKVDATIQRYSATGQADVTQARFQTQNPDKALVVLGKLLADIELANNVTIKNQSVAGKPMLLLTVQPTLYYISATQGRTAMVWSSTSLESLEAFITPQLDLWQFSTSMPSYPQYLDRFDRYGWGMYGLGTLSNHHNWMNVTDEGPGFKDPIEDLEFLAKYKIRFEPWLDPAGFDNSDGIEHNTEVPWVVNEAAKRDLPMGMRVYGSIGGGGANWTDRRFPEYGDEPADFLTSGWHGPEIYWKARKHMSWSAPEIHRYGTRKTMDMIAPYADNPYVMSLMSPYGELRHDTWYDMHADYSHWAQTSWRQYLQQKGYSLDRVTKMFQHEHLPYTSWDQVPVPEYAHFAGLNGRVLSLAGDWYVRAEDKLDDGLKAKWWETDIDEHWQSMHMPGSDSIFEVFAEKNSGSAWFRRSFDWPVQSDLNDKPLYLYWFTITHGKFHSGDNARFHSIYLNGKKAGEVGGWGAVKINDFLKPGTNTIALHDIGGVWNGRIFISTQEPRVYPYLGKDTNQLWMDWKDWLISDKYKTWAMNLGGMRQVAPNQPIKYMAPIGFGTDKWLELSTNYGGWAHFTGEGIWFFPWYKRYSFLYDLPATSETAGPAKNVQDQFNSYRRTFLAGLNGHDAVFLTQTYTRNKALRQWWIDHMPVIHQMGRYDIDGPQVLLYRSTRAMEYNPMKPQPATGQNAREIQNCWDWDLGRGTLQTLGQSYLYLDDKSLADGKMYGYPLMIDSGNENFDPKALDNIMQWVEAGGTYVTLPFTARSLLLEPDSWALAKRVGANVIGTRELNTGKVTFAKDQKVFPGFAGQSFADNGQSLDWVGNNHNLYSTELDPGKNGQVIASYDNGKAAIVRVPVGRGQVILMGSAFWRGAQDRNGIWWPQALETRFISALLSGINFDKPLCASSDPLVWAQPYRTNNGLDRVTTLVSWHEDKDVTIDVAMPVSAKPQQLVSISINGVTPLQYTITDGMLHAKVDIAAKEVVLLMLRDAKPDDALAHWWNYQASHWKPVQVSDMDFGIYDQGKWEDPTMDLLKDWQFTQQQPGESWLEATSDNSSWKSADMGVLNFNGAQPNKATWARKSFILPEGWANRGGTITLVSGAWSGPHYHRKASLYLNGQMLHAPTTNTYNSFDVTRLLKPDGSNVLAIMFEEGDKYVGLSGEIYLYQRAPASSSVSLAGSWDYIDPKGVVKTMTIPTPVGKRIRGSQPTMQIDIPANWKGKYRVRLYMQGSNTSVLGAYVNDHLVRRHHHRFGELVDIDITDQLIFGQTNILELACAGAERSGTRYKQHDWQIFELRLDLFE